MKKIIAMAMALMMMLCMFAACESGSASKGSDYKAEIEAIKAASAKVSEVVFTDAETDMTIAVTMAADATEDDVKAAFEAVKAAASTDEFVAEKFFHNTEEKFNKTFTVNFTMGDSSDVAYEGGATYSAGKGRKGMLYVPSKAWSGPEAVTAE